MGPIDTAYEKGRQQNKTNKASASILMMYDFDYVL